MTDFEKMSVNELVTLKANVDRELEKRERQAYDKALKKFFDALDELYSNFPDEYCFTDRCVTWEELRENNNWDV
jgi:hypothetical protein